MGTGTETETEVLRSVLPRAVARKASEHQRCGPRTGDSADSKCKFFGETCTRRCRLRNVNLCRYTDIYVYLSVLETLFLRPEKVNMQPPTRTRPSRAGESADSKCKFSCRYKHGYIHRYIHIPASDASESLPASSRRPRQKQPPHERTACQKASEACQRPHTAFSDAGRVCPILSLYIYTTFVASSVREAAHWP